MSMTPHRIVIAPDSFKGTMRAADAAAAIAEGWIRARPGDELVMKPMADGGEGTLDAFAAAVPDSKRVPVTVEGPTGEPVETSWLRLPRHDSRPVSGPAAGPSPAQDRTPVTAVIELACTAGIELLPDGLRPLDASSRGFGQAIRHALDAGARRLLLAIGGSASSDGGAGVLEALGARLLDTHGDRIGPGARGLESLHRVDLANLVPPPEHGICVLSDVSSPLLGPRGSAHVFGPQKGASPAEVVRIDTALTRWSTHFEVSPETPGTGAAGGVGFGLLAWGAELASGAELVAETIGLDTALAGAALAITGEGSFDDQTGAGKAPTTVIARARALGVPAAVIAGRVTGTHERLETLSLTDLAGSGERAMEDPARWLAEAGERLATALR